MCDNDTKKKKNIKVKEKTKIRSTQILGVRLGTPEGVASHIP